jgi:dsRNA-specific ribonuclease
MIRTLFLRNRHSPLVLRNYAKLVRGDNKPKHERIVEEEINISQTVTAPQRVPKKWKDTSPANEAVTNFTPQLVRGKDISIAGKVYFAKEITAGLSKLIEALPMLQQLSTERDLELLTRAVTHKSYGTGKVPTNENMAFLGKYILDAYVLELVIRKYPLGGLTTIRTLKLLRAVYTNRSYLGWIVADKMWKIDPNETLRTYGWEYFSLYKQKDELANMVYSLIAAVYSAKGPSVAQSFIQQYIVTEIPKKILDQLVQLPEHTEVFEDLIEAHLHSIPRVVEELDEVQRHYVCSYFIGLDLIGYATADSPDKAKTLAAMNGLFQIIAKTPHN